MDKSDGTVLVKISDILGLFGGGLQLSHKRFVKNAQRDHIIIPTWFYFDQFIFTHVKTSSIHVQKIDITTEDCADSMINEIYGQHMIMQENVKRILESASLEKSFCCNAEQSSGEFLQNDSEFCRQCKMVTGCFDCYDPKGDGSCLFGAILYGLDSNTAKWNNESYQEEIQLLKMKIISTFDNKIEKKLTCSPRDGGLKKKKEEWSDDIVEMIEINFLVDRDHDRITVTPPSNHTNGMFKTMREFHSSICSSITNHLSRQNILASMEQIKNMFPNILATLVHENVTIYTAAINAMFDIYHRKYANNNTTLDILLNPSSSRLAWNFWSRSDRVGRAMDENDIMYFLSQGQIFFFEPIGYLHKSNMGGELEMHHIAKIEGCPIVCIDNDYPINNNGHLKKLQIKRSNALFEMALKTHVYMPSKKRAKKLFQSSKTTSKNIPINIMTPAIIVIKEGNHFKCLKRVQNVTSDMKQSRNVKCGGDDMKHLQLSIFLRIKKLVHEVIMLRDELDELIASLILLQKEKNQLFITASLPNTSTLINEPLNNINLDIEYYKYLYFEMQSLFNTKCIEFGWHAVFKTIQ